MSPSNIQQKRTGEIFLFGYIVISGLFPIIVNYETRHMAPVLFAGLSTLTAGFGLFMYLIFRRGFRRFDPKLWKYILGNTGINVIFAFTFFFIGASKTSAINASLLSQSELFFTFIICGLFFGEKITLRKTLGAFIILAGTVAVLFKGSFNELNIGDIFIVIPTMLYPFGNMLSKKAIHNMDPTLFLFIRSALGGLGLIIISFFLEHSLPANGFLKTDFLLILINGLLILGIAKMFWFEGLKRLDMSTSISIITAIPAASLIYAAFFLREIPTPVQFTGFILTMLGLFILTRQKPSHTLEGT